MGLFLLLVRELSCRSFGAKRKQRVAVVPSRVQGWGVGRLRQTGKVLRLCARWFPCTLHDNGHDGRQPRSASMALLTLRMVYTKIDSAARESKSRFDGAG